MRLVAGASRRPRAGGRPPVASGAAAPAAATLRLFWYPRDIRHETARGHLIAAAHRLGRAIEELRDDVAPRPLADALDAFEYHLENLAMRLSEVRERLLDVNDLAPDPVTAAPRRRRSTAPIEVARLLDLLADDLPLRDPRGARVFLHLAVFVAGRPFDAHAAVGASPGTAAARRAARLALRHAIDRYARRAAGILELTLAVADGSDG
jgi:hypothetical protein